MARPLALVPLLMVMLRRWPPGQGVATAVFLIGYGGLRFLVDQFRDYESSLGGLGPGQWFNIGMAAFGVVMLVVCLNRSQPREAAKPVAAGSVSVFSAVILLLLVLFPLSIPTSWTTDYLAIKRGTATETTAP